jgi:predicted dehydrogenase
MASYPVCAAILGVGAWARVLATAAQGSSKIRFACGFGRTPARVAKFAHELGLRPCGDFDALMRDPEIDAVVIALPNELHFDYAQRAAAAGKHVFIEKPIATTLRDGLRVAALERTHEVRVAVGHCARLLSGNRLIRQAIDRSQLGKVTQIEANFSNGRGLRLSPDDWRWFRASAPGGSLSQLAIHQFDTLRYLGGDIAAVSARAARQSPLGAEVEDQWIISVRFADGKLGTVISNWTSPSTYTVRVTGDAALMFYEVDQMFWGVPERLHDAATLYFQPRGSGPTTREPIAVPPGNMFRDELELFADSIVASAPCELSADNGCQALAAVYAAIESAENRGAEVLLADVLERARAKVRAAPGASA